MKINKTLAGAGLGLAALLLTACGGTSDPLGETSGQPSASESSAASAEIVVGSADFTENKILAEIYSQALQAKGLQSSTKLSIGSREIYIKALQDGSISAVPEYTGNLLQYFDANATATTAEEVQQALPEALPCGLAVLTSSNAVDQDVYVVTKEYSEAERHHVSGRSEEDLRRIDAGRDAGTGEAAPTGRRAWRRSTARSSRPSRRTRSTRRRSRISTMTRSRWPRFFTTDSVISEKGYVELDDPQA